MKDLTPQQQRKIEKIASVVADGELAIIEHIFELEERFDETVNKIKETVPNLDDVLKTIKGKDGIDGIDGEDSVIPGPKGDRGDKGDKDDPGINGKDGKEGKNGREGRDGSDRKIS